MKISQLLTVAAIAATAVLSPVRVSATTDSPQAESHAEAITDDARLARAMGTVLGSAVKQSIDQFVLAGMPVDRQLVLQTLMAYVEGQPTGYDLRSADEFISDYLARRRAATNVILSDETQQAFLAEAAAVEGAVTMPSGLVFRVITEGEGVMPTDGDSVSVDYVGRLSDGTVFDATESPVVFTVGNLVPGFVEGLKMMKPGGTYEVTFPASLGYGAEGVPGAIPGNAALQFTVQMHEVMHNKAS